MRIKNSIGNHDLLKLPKTAFLCSRRVPAAIISKCCDWAIEQRAVGRCVISGFQSTIERDVFYELLKGTQPIIMALHRWIGPEIETQFAKQIESGRLLIISPFGRWVRRGGAAEVYARNELMTNLAEHVVIGHASGGGELARLLTTLTKPISFVSNQAWPKKAIIESAPLILTTRSGHFTYEGRPCTECGKSTILMFMYKKSSKGPVVLCDDCNTAAAERSFGKIDAMHVAKLSSFESNRRKH